MDQVQYINIFTTSADELINDSETNESKILPLGFGLTDDAETRRIIHFVSAIFLTISGCLGFVGNCLVLYVFGRYQRLRSGGGPLILSLATADLMVSVLHILPAYSSFVETWSFGKLGCDVYAGATGLGGLASLITLSAIAADRFCVIFGRPVTCLARQTTCFCIWSLSMMLVLPPFFGWSEFRQEGLGTSCSWDYSTRTASNRLYYVFLLVLGFVLPVTIIVVSYIGIVLIVCQHSRNLRGFSRNGVLTTSLSKTDIRTAQVVLTIVLCFLVSWTPYAVVSLIGQFGEPESLTQLGTALPALFAKGSVIYNPIIYGLSHPHFRTAVQSIWTKSTSNRNLAQHLCYQQSTRLMASNVQLQPIQTSRNSIMITTTTRKSQKRLSDDRASSTQTFKLGSSLLKPEPKNSQNGNFRISRQSLASVNRISMFHQHQTCGLGVDYRTNSKQDLLKATRKHSLPRKFNYSAPDLHRDGRIVRNPNLMSLSEYRRIKQKWLWKVLFRSEGSLTDLLRSDGFNQLAKLANREIIAPPKVKKRSFVKHRHSPRHYPHPLVERSSITFHRGSTSARSSISTAAALASKNNDPHRATRRHTEPKIDDDGNRKKSTTSILHRSNQSKRDSNLLALPLRFEDGIPSGQEDSEQHTPSSIRRSSTGRKSSSSGSKGSGAVGRKSILDLFIGQSWMRRKSSNNSEATAVSHYTCSQQSGSQSKKFSFESTFNRHQVPRIRR